MMMGLVILFAVAAALILLGGASALVWQLRYPPRKTFAVALGRGQPTVPAELQLDAQETTFSLADGSATPRWLIRGDQTDGPVVLVAHGYADSRYGALTWAPLLIAFASQVVVFDQRGHGDAQAPASNLGAREADDLIGLLDQLPTTQPVVLFGYSMGAGIAIAAAAQATKRTTGPAVIGAIADGPYRYWHEPVAAILKMKRYPHRPLIFLAGLFLRLTIRGLDRFDRVNHARQLRCPLLVLHSSTDELCPFASGQAIADAAPQGEMVRFNDAAHTQLADADPARYRQALQQFFSRLEGNAIR